MKTLYALVLACLSFPALAWEPESYSYLEDNLTLSVTVPVTPNYDYSIDTSIDFDDHTATVISPASKPSINETIDATFDLFGEEYTAAVISPSDAPIADTAAEPIRYVFDNEGVEFKLPEEIDDSIGNLDW
jgi:hypothetical protein